MLTEALLKEMNPGQVIASGFTPNTPSGVYMTSNHINRMLIWVAVRGRGYHDWAIYCAWDGESDIEATMRNGQKIQGTENIRLLVPCDDSAMSLYRK